MCEMKDGEEEGALTHEIGPKQPFLGRFLLVEGSTIGQGRREIGRETFFGFLSVRSLLKMGVAL